MMFADGRMYRGAWYQDMFHGNGILKMSSEQSLIVEGRFDNNLFAGGQGKIQYPTGELYEGKLTKQYKREGLGKFYFVNGDKYEGQWSNDKRHGTGKLFFLSGAIFEGEFRDD